MGNYCHSAVNELKGVNNKNSIQLQNEIRAEKIKISQTESSIIYKLDSVLIIRSSVKIFKVEMKLKDGAQSVFHQAYDMPYVLKNTVESELHKMCETWILNKVSLVMGQVSL